MRALIIDEEAKRKAEKVLTHAEEHPYVIGDDGIPVGDAPGNDPQFVTYIPVGYRCVFTYTLAQNKTYRHLSISVPAAGKYPNTFAAFELARLFGFTGYADDGKPASDWLVDIQPVDNCVVIAQERP